jgi:large subunit ribosomal protein L30
MNKIKISQKLSLIGKTKKQISCVKGLGLRRIRDSKIIEATPENLGMINTVKHMISVEHIKE